MQRWHRVVSAGWGTRCRWANERMSQGNSWRHHRYYKRLEIDSERPTLFHSISIGYAGSDHFAIYNYGRCSKVQMRHRNSVATAAKNTAHACATPWCRAAQLSNARLSRSHILAHRLAAGRWSMWASGSSHTEAGTKHKVCLCVAPTLTLQFCCFCLARQRIVADTLVSRSVAVAVSLEATYLEAVHD